MAKVADPGLTAAVEFRTLKVHGAGQETGSATGVADVGEHSGVVPFAVELCEWQTPCFLRQCYATFSNYVVGRGQRVLVPPPPARSPPNGESSDRHATA